MTRTSFLFVSFFVVMSTSYAKPGTIEQLGDVGQYVLPYTAFMISISDKQYDDTRRFGYSYATTLAIMYTTKYLVNEQRPNGGDYSFPSGHTTSAFSGAAFIASEYGWQWGVPAYLAAGYVGWSRVYANKHWPHDVAAGAALAIGVNYFFSGKADKTWQLRLLPTGKGIAGLFQLRI